jgi:hypothetical protein
VICCCFAGFFASLGAPPPPLPALQAHRLSFDPFLSSIPDSSFLIPRRLCSCWHHWRRLGLDQLARSDSESCRLYSPCLRSTRHPPRPP